MWDVVDSFQYKTSVHNQSFDSMQMLLFFTLYREILQMHRIQGICGINEA